MLSGVHPFDGKEFSKDMPIRELKPGKELVYLLSQHIGAPAKASATSHRRPASSAR